MAKKPEIRPTLSTLNTRTGPKKEKQYHFQYWADGLDFDWDLDEDNFDDKSAFYMDKVFQLAALRRAASNFVRILTGDDAIRVVYSSGKDSYTDGRTVVISAEDDPTKFDKTVAIALHEASHCLLTDFNFATFLFKMCPDKFFPSWCRKSVQGWYTLRQNAMMIMNVIEDRRIDDFIYRTAVGYRPYYDVLYKELWNSKEVSKALRIKKEWQVPSVEAYMERIINISNPVAWETRHLLPGMDEIYEIFDLKNIRRLNNEPNSFRAFLKQADVYNPRSGMAPDPNQIPREWFTWDGDTYAGDQILSTDRRPEAFQMTLDILAVIEKYVTPSPAMPAKGKGQQGNVGEGEESDEDGEEAGAMPDLDMSDGLPDSTESELNDGKETDRDDTAGQGPTSTGKKRLTKAEREQTINDKKLEKELEKIKDFVSGDIRKKKIEKKIAADIEAMDSASAALHEVGNDQIGRGRVLVTEKLTDAILAADWFLFADRDYYTGEVRVSKTAQDNVARGTRMGQILVHRLQVRNEQLTTKFPNQLTGHIDRRVLARLGMEIESVFTREVQDKFRPALLHLSLDASGSMSGDKWNKTSVVATALAYAASKISNLDVIISIRGGVRNDHGMAHMAIVHDSRKDAFAHFRRFFTKLIPSGSTPEGLCFEAIMEQILKDTNDYSVYFVNISDGEPAFNATPVGAKGGRRRRSYYYQPVDTDMPKGIDYSGERAYRHTRHQVNKMREAGIRVLSYFVTSVDPYGGYYSRGEASKNAFRLMYGEDAAFIDVTQVTGILTTLNKLLLKKQ